MAKVQLEIRPHKSGELFFISKVGGRGTPTFHLRIKTYNLTKQQAEKTLEELKKERDQ